jgi:hypothetical protein
MHYERVLKYGDPGPLESHHGVVKFCSVEDCDRPIPRQAARGLCGLHYLRWRRTGDPRVNRRDNYRTRLLGPTQVMPDGCVYWTGKLLSTGYGQIGDGHGKIRGVHVAMYEQFVRPVPAGMVIHHICEVPKCVAPWHLRAVTQKDHLAIHRGELEVPPW